MVLTPECEFMVLATDGVWDVFSNDDVSYGVWQRDREKESERRMDCC